MFVSAMNITRETLKADVNEHSSVGFYRSTYIKPSIPNKENAHVRIIIPRVVVLRGPRPLNAFQSLYRVLAMTP